MSPTALGKTKNEVNLLIVCCEKSSGVLRIISQFQLIADSESVAFSTSLPAPATLFFSPEQPPQGYGSRDFWMHGLNTAFNDSLFIHKVKPAQTPHICVEWTWRPISELALAAGSDKVEMCTSFQM